MTVALLTSQQPAEALDLGVRWAGEGHDVTVVLLDAATAVLRNGHRLAARLRRAHTAGVTVWAHERAVAERRLLEAATGVALVDLDRVAELVGDAADTVQWW